MSKSKTVFICQSCGNVSSKWLGRCAECSEWNSYIEEVTERKKESKSAFKSSVTVTPLSEIKGVDCDRIKSNLSELDLVLGGGIVKGSVVLIGGEPGIGKSTVILQVAGILAKAKNEVLYLTGEESPTQIKLRADRLSISAENIDILASTSFEEMLTKLDDKRYDYVVIDSIQTIASAELTSIAGTVGQVRHITYRLVEIAKSCGITVFIIGQVTKDGNIAGPKMLEHLVDTVLYFEGDYTRGVRILRAVKNRFGSTDEVGVFEMTSQGLVEASDKIFINDGESKGITGRSISPIIEGSRPFLVEIEALVAPTFFQFPKRNANGFDVNRLTMLIAILEKKAMINLSACDIYLNIAGGLKVNEPAADLAVIVAIISSFKEIEIDKSIAFAGEVGLTGYLRVVPNMGARINEAAKFKMTKFLSSFREEKDDRLSLVNINDIAELIKFIDGLKKVK